MDAENSPKGNVLPINETLAIPLDEIEMHAIRAQGPGGQNVNKVSSAVHLRFEIGASSLPDEWKENLLALRDDRVSRAGIVVIKARRFRTREKNRADALQRLAALVASAGVTRPPRKPTRPSRTSKRRRMDNKSRRGQLKRMRSRPEE